jgi:hypothetical protein
MFGRVFIDAAQLAEQEDLVFVLRVALQDEPPQNG